MRLSGVVVNVLAFGPRGPGFETGPEAHATILLGSNLAQIVYSHCLTSSLLSSKKLGYKRQYYCITSFLLYPQFLGAEKSAAVFGLDRFNGITYWVP